MISYNVAPEDYLTYQLYMASKSKDIRNKRGRNWLLIPIIYLTFAALAFFIGKQKNIALVFGILATLWLVLYPFYTQWMYKDKFKKAIIKNNKEIFGKKVSLKIVESNLEISDTLNTSSQKLKDIAAISEISTHIFIKLKKGSSIIIPKLELRNSDDLVKFVQILAKNSGIKVNKELTWKWR